MTAVKRLLNIGGCSKDIPLPPMFKDYEHVLLDNFAIREQPDILMDAKEIVDQVSMKGQYDVVYCSHVLEHLRRQDTGAVLRGMYHAVKPDGFVMIRVPDVVAAVQDMVSKDKQFHQQPFPEAKEAINREITYHSVIYGSDALIKGNPGQQHLQAFTLESLTWGLDYVGFKEFHGKSENLEIIMIAFKEAPSKELLEFLYG